MRPEGCSQFRQRKHTGYLYVSALAILAVFPPLDPAAAREQSGYREAFQPASPGSQSGAGAGVLAPDLTAVSPAVLVGLPCQRPLTLSGEGFRDDLQVVVSWHGGEKAVAKEQVKYLDSRKAEIWINTGIDPDRWMIKVRNGSGPFSNSIALDVRSAGPGDVGTVIGEFNGVQARSNGACTALSKDTTKDKCSTNYQCEAPYQCVDYVKRYYREHFPAIQEVQSEWGSAAAFWARAEHKGLQRVAYSESGQSSCELPQPGSMIFFETGHPEGHIAIVTAVADDKISIVQQNIDRFSGMATLAVKKDPRTGSCRVGPTMTLRPLSGGLGSDKRFPVIGWLSVEDSRSLNEAMLVAIEEGDLARVKRLVERGADVNCKGRNMVSALQWAVVAQQQGTRVPSFDVIDYLISRGASVQDGAPFSLFSLIVESETLSLDAKLRKIDVMLEKGFDLNGDTKHEGSAMEALMSSGTPELARALLARGLRVDWRARQCGDQGWAAQRPLLRPSGLAVLEVLMDAGFEESCLRQHGRGTNALVCGVVFGCSADSYDVATAIRAVDFLASRGFSMNATCRGTPILDQVDAFRRRLSSGEAPLLVQSDLRCAERLPPVLAAIRRQIENARR